MLRRSFEKDGERYADAVNKMVADESTTLYVNHEHVGEFDARLAAAIQEEYYRCIPRIAAISTCNLCDCWLTCTSRLFCRSVEPYLREALRTFVLDLHPEYERGDRDELREFYGAFHGVGQDVRCACLAASIAIPVACGWESENGDI